MGSRQFALVAVAALLIADASAADVALIEARSVRKELDKRTATTARHPGGLRSITAAATGSAQLTDSAGLRYFINTDITFSTSSSASAAMSEASYAGPVAATTSGGGTTPSTLSDSFDGYNALCLSLNNTVATCETGNLNFVMYNLNGGPPTTDCSGRQLLFPIQTSGTIQMSRKVLVPSNDSFARWLNVFTNTGGAPQTLTMVIANNLGSDSNTAIVTTSSGDTLATVADNWVTTFQNYSGTTSSDPRLAHVLQGPGAAVTLAGVNFANGDDNPFWGYTLTLQPGETQIIMNFVSGQPSKAAAAAKAAALTAQPIPANAIQCMTATEQQQVVNFAIVQPPAITATKTASGAPFKVGGTVTYTVVLSNTGAGPQPDNPTDEFTDVLPSTLALVSANATSGTATANTGTNTVTWNGAISAGGSVTITIQATILPSAAGATVSNQGTAAFDADGDGTNEATAVTDDPAVGGAADPTVISVAALTVAEIPTLTRPGFITILLLLGVSAVTLLRRRL